MGVGGTNAGKHGVCPVAIDVSADGFNGGKNGERLCWAVKGTFCDGKVEGTFVQEIRSCTNCDFFKKVENEEGFEQFMILKPDRRINLKYD